MKRLSSILKFSLLSLATAVTALVATSTAGAATISATASPFTGDPLSVSVLIDDDADPGNLVITVSVDGGGNTGDLRGFFAHVADESLVSGLSVVGGEITSDDFDVDDVINLGGGNNLNGGGTPCPCDFGVEIGTSGMGADDIQSTTFTLSHVSEALTIALFTEQEFGVRATSVGMGSSRGGSSKLSGQFPIPEPATSFMLLFGLAGLASVRADGRN